MKHTKESFAQLLDGREMGNEITPSEEALAKHNGLVVIFGYSDDNVEFCGALHDELGCYNGGTFYLHRTGVFDSRHECDCEFCFREKQKEECAELNASYGSGDYCWEFETEVPYASFKIMEDGERFCRGIVIDVKDLPVI